MHHIAIMNKAWKLIPKIVSGEKSIESRWYKTRRIPWNAVKKGDVIYFKNSGEKVTAKAEVQNVLQFEITGERDIKNILNEYGKYICLVEPISNSPKYCILIFLQNASYTEPFNIDKKGFGGPAAWLTVDAIDKLRIK